MSDSPATDSFDPIVITGMGLITPLGLSLEETWRQVIQSRSGFGPMSAIESPLSQQADGGQAPDLPTDFAPSLPRESRYLLHTIGQALASAGIGETFPYQPNRCGILLGTTLHGMRAGGVYLRSGDPAALKYFLSGSVLRNVIENWPIRGCALTNCSACSSSLGSIAMACSLLRSGQLDLVIAGGYDTISEYVYGGFNSLRLVAPGPLRPFARDRQGMKIAEGYGIVVLERMSGTQARGAKHKAAILGYGESADAHHLTQPHPDGEGAARAIQQALDAAGLKPADIDLIAAHATGTPDNDAAEYAAMSRVFGSGMSETPVVAFKSHLGHTLGGAGAVELILSAKCLIEQMIPGCANLRREDVAFTPFNLSIGQGREEVISTTLNTSLGFGGANTCIVLGSAPRPLQSHRLYHRRSGREVFVAGVGVLFPSAIGNDAFVEQLERSEARKGDAGAVADDQILSLLNARRVRRMSEYVKLSLAATMLCLKNAGIEDFGPFAPDCAAILGSAHGSTNYCEQYYGQIVREGITAANPMLFAEGVPNAAAAHLSLMLGLKGPCQTIIGSRTAGLDALGLATIRIRAGEWERAIVGAADEYSATINAAYARWGLYGAGGFSTSAGAVSLLLESRSAMEQRGGRPLAKLLSYAGGMARGGKLARLARDVYRRIGSPSLMFGSSNDTWIERVEVMAGGADATRILPMRNLPESFSATPMAALAAPLLSETLKQTAKQSNTLGVTAVEYAGAVSAVAMEMIS